jgi:hypothetical protein
LAFAHRARGIRELFADFAPLSLQDFAWETPIPESGMTVDNDLPDFPKLLHCIDTHLQRKTSIYQAFKGVLLMGEVSGIFAEFPNTADSSS